LQKENTPKNKLAKLPAATQTGANTFGCLVNGKAWVAQTDCKYLCDPAFKIYYDNMLGGYMALSAKLQDSKNNIDQEIDIVFKLTNFKNYFFFIKGNNHLNIRFLNYNGNTYNTVVDPTVNGNCQVQLTHYDLQTGIISGTFEFYLTKPNCENISVTNGRFDYKLF
jgi:hypothetical protein